MLYSFAGGEENPRTFAVSRLLTNTAPADAGSNSGGGLGNTMVDMMNGTVIKLRWLCGMLVFSHGTMSHVVARPPTWGWHRRSGHSGGVLFSRGGEGD